MLSYSATELFKLLQQKQQQQQQMRSKWWAEWKNRPGQ